jgi:hypothetical protein
VYNIDFLHLIVYCDVRCIFAYLCFYLNKLMVWQEKKLMVIDLSRLTPMNMMRNFLDMLVALRSLFVLKFK